MSRTRAPKPAGLIARRQARYDEYIVDEPSELLRFLVEKVTGGNRQKAKTLLSYHSVMVEKQMTSQFNLPLSPGQKVQIKAHGNRHEFRHRMLSLVYEDAYLIVVNKKEGLLSVATETQKERTAQHILLDYVRLGNRQNRIFVVHRLDRATSGIMMYAKDEKTQRTLRDNWHDIVYDRRYVAVVEGNVEKNSGVCHSFLTDHGLHVVSSPVDDGGKEAVTHYRVIRRGNGYSLVELMLETGRKNQIRVHMRDLGHPIAGDRRYGAKTDPIGRMCLHAFKLCFYHPVTRETMAFEEPYPQKFKDLLSSSRKRETADESIETD